jgi:hypothetical protein
MALPKHQRAEQALSALESLDLHAGERAELEAAGVATRLIDELLPTQFSDLVPGLMKHLANPRTKHLYERAGLARIQKQAKEVTRRMNYFTVQKKQAEAESDQSIVNLSDHLIRTWEQRYPSKYYPSKRPPEKAVLHPLLLWEARWAMLNYESLPQHSREAANNLMLAVDEVWKFPRARPVVESSHE